MEEARTFSFYFVLFVYLLVIKVKEALRLMSSVKSETRVEEVLRSFPSVKVVIPQKYCYMYKYIIHILYHPNIITDD